MRGLPVLCNAVCESAAGGAKNDDAEDEERDTTAVVEPVASRPRRGPVGYSSEANLPLLEPAIREGELLHLCPDDGRTFRKVRLRLVANGFSIIPIRGERVSTISIAWSPFSLVQACRLHTVQADASQPWLRLFKVSIFHHGLTHFFATSGDKADSERARWVADISRTLRMLTQSLFPQFSIAVEPLPGASWTATRLLAGYLLLFDHYGVSLVYGELHAHCDSAANFGIYEDENCDVQVAHLSVDMDTCVSERVGIDCSCFSLGDYHFSTRSCAEKMIWLRAISNIKVKLRHWAANPSPTDLRHYRASVLEHAEGLPEPAFDDRSPLLPRRAGQPAVPTISLGASSGCTGGAGSPVARAWQHADEAPPVATLATLVVQRTPAARA